MRLPSEFYRLPLRFDVERLRHEVHALPAAAWSRHPTDFEGNSSVRLISVDGEENDEVSGAMRATPHLLQSPYIQQVLASFGVVWSRSRLMRLAPGSSVPEHADVNYHWFTRVRVHIPVITRPEVTFHCGARSVHMAAGEAWVFDNWRRHRVENPTDAERIHLVADTSGSAAFWQLVAASPDLAPRFMPYEAGKTVRLVTEQSGPFRVMPPSEVELLLFDLRAELAAEPDTAAQEALLRFKTSLDGFCREWRQVWSVYGDADTGRADYLRLLDWLRAQGMTVAKLLRMRTNQVPLMNVLEGRLLQHALAPVAAAQRAPAAAPRPWLDRPIFIVSAPRSGSTLLFETLACSPQLWNLGGEAHWLVESIPALQPGAPGVESNRLTAEHASAPIAAVLRQSLFANLRDAAGRPWQPDAGALRLLEKTPKNSLRIPFFDRLFPDARFIFLWRDPRENLSSIMEAWRDGRWITYSELSGWDGPWSLLLPPGWQSLRGKPLEEIAAYQWDCTNRTILQDLQALPHERWCSVSYADLLDRTGDTIAGLCRAVGLKFDEALAQRVQGPLPLSRFTHTPPARDKWRKNADAIERVLPSLQTTWDALRGL